MQNLFPRHLFGAPFLYDLRDIGIEIRKRVMAKESISHLRLLPIQSESPGLQTGDKGNLKSNDKENPRAFRTGIYWGFAFFRFNLQVT